ncbi:MAG TPA: alpha/beta hydrolase, partial [Acidimicrobiales bacterium]|nr:alpha/beta hydrolase [Acidimicrobiales bacterium]
MTTATVNGITLAYETIGEGRPWVVTPGGRFTKESPGVRELSVELAAHGNRVLIWDRPNCGESDVCFEGASESAMQADALVGLLEQLDMTPAVIIGGSGGARVSLLAAAHRGAAQGLAIWWISGGVYGLLSLAMHYCGGSLAAAWTSGGMEAVAELPEWAEVIERNPGNRQRFLDQDPKVFIETMERWML